MIINIFVIKGDLNGENRSGAFLFLSGIVPSLSLSESQTVWIQIRSDILSVLIWF